MDDLQIFDNTETIEFWHRGDDTVDVIFPAVLRRFRHRRYEKTAVQAVPMNYGHWYFAVGDDVEVPLPGDELVQQDDTVWTITDVNTSSVTGVWQCVCVSSSKLPPTEFVDIVHPAENVEPLVVAEYIAARTGELAFDNVDGEMSERLTLYLKGTHSFSSGDFLRRSDGSYWQIIQAIQPIHRNGWTLVECRV
ncbi:hypothetical protein FACS1894170_01920 [Planctomycetales bacterium]|nr:hypothetical protein FACS1894170_01920 [Planctomycetales bacterium]